MPVLSDYYAGQLSFISQLFVLPIVIFCRWHFTAFCVCCYNNWHSIQDNWLRLSQNNQNTPFQLSFLFLAQTDQWLLSFAERMASACNTFDWSWATDILLFITTRWQNWVQSNMHIPLLWKVFFLDVHIILSPICMWQNIDVELHMQCILFKILWIIWSKFIDFFL